MTTKETRSESPRRFAIVYKHPAHGSGRLGWESTRAKTLLKDMAAIQEDPGRFGLADWLKDADLWVVNDHTGESVW